MYPELMKLGPLTIHSYGFFIALGFTFGILVALWRGKKFGLDSGIILDMAIYIIISAIVGSRIFYIIVNYKDYLNDPLRIFYIHQGGLVFYGGLIGVLITTAYYIKVNKLDYFTVADAVIPALPVGHFFGRMGCFLNGCCYGAHTSCVTGIVFPNFRGDTVPRHPTQLYEAFACLFFFFVLLMIEKKIDKWKGALFATYIYLYSFWRFAIEFVRDDNRGEFWFGMSPSQNTSLIGILFATGLLFYVIKKSNDRNLKIADNSNENGEKIKLDGPKETN